jgi:hypothetical protein
MLSWQHAIQPGWTSGLSTGSSKAASTATGHAALARQNMSHLSIQAL